MEAVALLADDSGRCRADHGAGKGCRDEENASDDETGGDDEART
jgi:hypothetical protein